MELECNATGSPMPDITWFKDGLQLTNTAHSKLTSSTTSHSEVSTLRIDLTTGGSSGDYKCIATNPGGSVSSYDFNIDPRASRIGKCKN